MTSPVDASGSSGDPESLERPEVPVPVRCGIVLHPATHTRSPAMHRAAYEVLGLTAHYEVFDVPPEALAKAVDSFRKNELRQFAVSIPHKESMLALVDEIDTVAETIGAINTVTRVGDALVGTNTDWIGALRALERETTLDGKCAVVLGAGGTARALVYGLRSQGAEVHVLNRTLERAKKLVRDLGAESAGHLEDLADRTPDILVNTTSVGLNEDRSPIPSESLGEGLVVLDAVYSPEVTRLLSDTRSRGGRPIGGKWMLVYQAIEQLRLWTRRIDAEPDEHQISILTRVMAQAFDDAGREP